MKKISIIAALVLSGCISIEMPGVVSDMVKAAKDVYKEARADKTEPTRAPATPARRALAHSYVGKDNELEADIKQLCVKEAAQRLNRIAGKEQGTLWGDRSAASLSDASVWSSFCSRTRVRPSACAIHVAAHIARRDPITLPCNSCRRYLWCGHV